MSPIRTHKGIAALIMLAVFLSHNALALAVTHMHVPHAAVAATLDDTGASGFRSAPLHEHHSATHPDPQAAEVPVAGTAADAPCEEQRTCLCCIGNCTSALIDSSARLDPVPVTAAPASAMPRHAARSDDSLYRPPISA